MPRRIRHSFRNPHAEDIALEHLCWATMIGGMNYADICTALGLRSRRSREGTERALAAAWQRLVCPSHTFTIAPQLEEAAE